MPEFNKKRPQNTEVMTGGLLNTCSIDTAEAKDEQAFGRSQRICRIKAGGTGRCGGRNMGRGVNPSASSGKGRGMRGQFR